MKDFLEVNNHSAVEVVGDDIMEIIPDEGTNEAEESVYWDNCCEIMLYSEE